MSFSTLKQCWFCGQSFEGGSNLCSMRCEVLLKFHGEFSKDVIEHQNTNDTRTFFYDIGFGELCDKYFIMFLRLQHQDKLKDKKETEFHLRRLLDAIMSKINRQCYHPGTKRNIAELTQELFKVNAQMWRLRDLVMRGHIDSVHVAATAYFAESLKRDDLRDQLDALVDGRIRLSRVYPS